MTREEIIITADRFCDYFEENGIGKETMLPINVIGHLADDILQFCHRMLGSIYDSIENKQNEVAIYWIGFISGCLLRHGAFSLNDLCVGS